MTDERLNGAIESLADHALRADPDGPWVDPNAALPILRKLTDEAVSDMRARKDAAYLERNRLVALLSVIFPAVRTRTAIEGWSEDWHGCVYIWLPNSVQCSWHYHDSHAHLFEHLPELAPGAIPWDGHTTEEKYRRIEEAVKYLQERGGNHAV